MRRNHGVELNRLDLSDGKSLWPGVTAFLDADRVNLTNADADADRVYMPAGNTLSAFILKDGKGAWEVDLPDARGASGWVVRAGQKCVIVYPEAAIPREPVADVLGRVVRSFRSEPRVALPDWQPGCMMRGSRRASALARPETGKRLGSSKYRRPGPR